MAQCRENAGEIVYRQTSCERDFGLCWIFINYIYHNEKNVQRLSHDEFPKKE